MLSQPFGLILQLSAEEQTPAQGDFDKAPDAGDGRFASYLCYPLNQA